MFVYDRTNLLDLVQVSDWLDEHEQQAIGDLITLPSWNDLDQHIGRLLNLSLLHQDVHF